MGLINYKRIAKNLKYKLSANYKGKMDTSNYKTKVEITPMGQHKR